MFRITTCRLPFIVFLLIAVIASGISDVHASDWDALENGSEEIEIVELKDGMEEEKEISNPDMDADDAALPMLQHKIFSIINSRPNQKNAQPPFHFTDVFLPPPEC